MPRIGTDHRQSKGRQDRERADRAEQIFVANPSALSSPIPTGPARACTPNRTRARTPPTSADGSPTTGNSATSGAGSNGKPMHRCWRRHHPNHSRQPPPNRQLRSSNPATNHGRCPINQFCASTGCGDVCGDRPPQQTNHPKPSTPTTRHRARSPRSDNSTTTPTPVATRRTAPPPTSSTSGQPRGQRQRDEDLRQSQIRQPHHRVGRPSLRQQQQHHDDHHRTPARSARTGAAHSGSILPGAKAHAASAMRLPAGSPTVRRRTMRRPGSSRPRTGPTTGHPTAPVWNATCVVSTPTAATARMPSICG